MSDPASKWGRGVITGNADKNLKGRRGQVGAGFALSTKEGERWQAAWSPRGAAEIAPTLHPQRLGTQRRLCPLPVLPASLQWQG